MAFDANTGTLLVLSKADDDAERSRSSSRRRREFGSLVSLGRCNNGWVEVQRLPIELPTDSYGGSGISVIDSRILLGHCEDDKLYAIDVNADHSLHSVGTIFLERKFRAFACTRTGTDTLVAVLHIDPASLFLYRLTQLQLSKLDAFDLIDSDAQLLFRNDVLLATVENDDTVCSEIVELRVSFQKFSRVRKILNSNADIQFDYWCLSGQRLAVWDSHSDDILLYAFE